MRKIDIFLSCAQDVEKERIVAERLIRSIAAEFGIPIIVSYSNWLRRKDEVDLFNLTGGKSLGEHEPALCVSFWEYQNDHLENGFKEHIPNTGQFDLVVCIVGSQLGPRLAPVFVMPDGSEPKCATDYEIGWVIDQVKRTPGFPGLHVYRNREIPIPAFESREQWDTFAQRWDATKQFFQAKEKEGGEKLLDACHDYQNLGEFEGLFREHFRNFLAKQLEHENAPKPCLGCFWKSNPFRGLDFFDFEHAPVYFGKTKATGEIVDALEKQAAGKRGFVMVVGPSGTGKSSLVRAGVLPLLTQLWNGRWRRALTRPTAGDPFEALASALLDRFALPELEEDGSVPWQNLAAGLREHPELTARQVGQTLERISRLEFDQLVAEQEQRLSLRKNGFGPESAEHQRSRRVKPSAQLALVVDQLEELFEFPAELRQAYIAALSALGGTDGVFVLTTIRSDFHPSYQQIAELFERAGQYVRYDLQLPKREEMTRMIQLPAKAAGLRFDRNPDTGRTLDEYLLDAALASPEPLPLLEHALSELYRKQLVRKDGMLSLTDYRELSKTGEEGSRPEFERTGFGELEQTLANHAESRLVSLRRGERRLLWPVMRQLVVPGANGEIAFRTISYRELIAPRDGDESFYAGAKNLVDHLVASGLLRASLDPDKNISVSLTHEVLLREWPRLWRCFCQERDSLAMRNRLDVKRRRWENGGRKKSGLIAAESGLAEAGVLIHEFRLCLNQAQIDYINRSLGKIGGRSRGTIALAAFGGLALLLMLGGSLFESRKKRAETSNYVALRASERNKRRVELNSQADGDQHNKIQLKIEQEKARQAQAHLDESLARSSTLEIELKEMQGKLKVAELSAVKLESQRSELEIQLKNEADKTRQVQENVGEAVTRSNALDGQLNQLREELKLAQANAEKTENHRIGLQVELKDEEDKAQEAQQHADQAISRVNALESELKETVEKLQVAQTSAGKLESERIESEIQLRNEEEKARQAQANVDAANVRSNALETQLKDAQGMAQVAQTNAAQAERLRSGLQFQLKNEEEKTQHAQQDAEQARASADEALRQSKTLEIKKDQDEQLRGFQTLMEMARVTTGNPAARRSVPFSVSNGGSLSIGQAGSMEESVPPKEQTDQANRNVPDEESVKAFVLDYLRTIAVNDVSAQQRFFADRVNFYSRGVLPLSKVQDATQGYHEEWPVREWVPRGSADVSRSSDPNLFVVRQPFTWKVSDGSQNSQGEALLYLRIRKNASGEFRIVKVQQRGD